MLGYIEDGKTEGARLVAGGDSGHSEGFFVRPTIFADVDNSMKIAQEEIFGPVGVVIPFDAEEEAIEIANATPYGLAASIWTSNVSTAHRVTGQIRAGSVLAISVRVHRFAQEPVSRLVADIIGRSDSTSPSRRYRRDP